MKYLTKDDLIEKLELHSPRTHDLSCYLSELLLFIRPQELYQMCETIPGLLEPGEKLNAIEANNHSDHATAMERYRELMRKGNEPHKEK